MAHPPQPPQTCHVTRHGSTHNNNGHPDPHPNGKDTMTGPTAHHTPQTTTHDSRHRLSWDTAHGPAAPPLPATESPHQHPPPATVTTPARPTQGKCQRPPTPMPMPHSPNTTASPQRKALTWHHPSAPLPDSMVQPPDAAAPHPCHPPPAPPMHHQHIAGDGGVWVGVRQVGELVPELLLLPCTPLPYKEWGYVVLLLIR
jgi:hypothetical protein